MHSAYAYLRISTEDQSNFSLEAQEEIIKKYASSHNFNIVKTYTDDGVSAKNFNRPAWKKLELDLSKSKGEVRAVIVAKYDRLIRNAAEGLTLLERFEMKLKVQIISAGENFYIDPHSPFYFKIRADMFVNAEFERRVISDRTRMGVWQARSQGRWVAPAPFGYQNEKGADGKPMLVLNHEKAIVVRQLFEDVSSGIPIADALRTARHHGYKHTGKGAAQRTLSKIIYAGFIEVPAYGREPAKTVKGRHEPIVSKALFDQVQDIISGKPQIHVQQREEFPLRGIVRCKQCNRGMTAGWRTGKMKKKYPYYNCNYCKAQNYNAEQAHKVLIEILQELSLPTELIIKLQEKVENQMQQRLEARAHNAKRLQIEIKELETQIGKLEEKYISDRITESTYKRYIGIWTRDLSGKHVELEQATTDERKHWEFFYKHLEKLSSIATIYANASIAGKQRIIREVFNNTLYITKAGYETLEINPLLHQNQLIINSLHITEITKKGDILGHVSLGSGGEA